MLPLVVAAWLTTSAGFALRGPWLFVVGCFFIMVALHWVLGMGFGVPYNNCIVVVPG